jgi:multidrug efflux pump subunit AcrA (membrane-fusion protein)
VLAAVTVIGAKELTAPQEPPAAAYAGSGAAPGVVRYAAGAPQLSSIGVNAVAEEPMPVAEPSNARVAYDENVTARVSSPVAGRVTALRAEIGEELSRNAALVEIDLVRGLWAIFLVASFGVQRMACAEEPARRCMRACAPFLLSMRAIDV